MNNVGAFLITRNIFDNDIWNKPSWWLKVWIYILGNVNYSDTDKMKRGDNFFDKNKIFIDCNLSKEGIKAKSILNVIEWLVVKEKIRTQKTTRGMIITVLNYAKYQDLINYKNDTEKEEFRKSLGKNNDTIKEEEKEKKEKNNIISKDIINSKELTVAKDNRNLEITETQEYIKSLVQGLGLGYKASSQERMRIKNILTGKDYGELCERCNMTRMEFMKHIFYIASRLSFWKDKIYNAETFYKHYIKIYNEAVSIKSTTNI